MINPVEASGRAITVALTREQCEIMKAAMRLDYSGSCIRQLKLKFTSEDVSRQLFRIRGVLNAGDTPSAACVALERGIVSLDDTVGNFPDLQLMLNSLTAPELEFLAVFYQCGVEERTTQNMKVGLRLSSVRSGIDLSSFVTKHAAGIYDKARGNGAGSCVSNKVQLSVLAYATGERGKHD